MKDETEQTRTDALRLLRAIDTTQAHTQSEARVDGLIVMGSGGLDAVRRALMGSVSDSVVRHAHCPVLIVREGREQVV